eukprot:scpid6787/ scgid5634/ Low-density lipoprotein receptor-related protein 5; Low-density lipoprotein receptor-related protein 7; Lr3
MAFVRACSRMLVTIALLLCSGLARDAIALQATSADPFHLFAYGDGTARAFQHVEGWSSDDWVQLHLVQYEGDNALQIKQLQLVGSDVFVLTNDNELRKHSNFNGTFTGEARTSRLVAKDVTAFAVDEFQSLVYYVSRERIPQAGSAEPWRLSVSTYNVSLQRTLIGNGAAPAADVMSVDSRNGFVYMIAKRSSDRAVLTRTKLDGSFRKELRFTTERGARLSSLVVSRSGKPAVFWIETSPTSSRLLRSLSTSKIKMPISSTRPGPVMHMWSTHHGIHILEDFDASNATARVRTFQNKNKNFRDDVVFGLGTDTSSPSHHSDDCTQNTCPGNHLCIPMPSASYTPALSYNHLCLRATTFSAWSSTRLNFTGLDSVLMLAAGDLIAAVFLNQFDANNSTIIEPFYQERGLKAGAVSGGPGGVFWTHEQRSASKVYKSSLDGADQTLLETNGIDMAQAIACEATSGVVLWNDDRRQITVESLDGRVRFVAVKSNYTLDGLAVDSSKGRVYWIEDSHYIMSSFLDGTGLKRVVEGNMSGVHLLAIDNAVSPAHLYWVDKLVINYLKLDGVTTHPKSLQPKLTIIPTAMTVGNGSIYLATQDSANQDSVYKVEARRGTWAMIPIRENIPGLSSISLISFSGPQRHSACEDETFSCSGVCLTNEQSERTCYCEPGSQPAEVPTTNKWTCRGPDPEVFMAGDNTLLQLHLTIQRPLAPSSLTLPECPHSKPHNCYVLAVDRLRHRIFIAVRGGQVIYASSYFNAPDKLVQVLNTGSPLSSGIGGMDFDVQSSNLFWTDSRSNFVEVAHIDRSTGAALHRTLLIKKGLHHPHHIAVDPVEGVMYVSMHNHARNESSVVVATMHGRTVVKDVYRAWGSKPAVHSMVLHRHRYKTPSRLSLPSLFLAVGADILHVDVTDWARTRPVHTFTNANITCDHLALSQHALLFTTKGSSRELFSAEIDVGLPDSGRPLSLHKAQPLSPVTVSSPIAYGGSLAAGEEIFGACSESWYCRGLCMPQYRSHTGQVLSPTGRFSQCFGRRTTVADPNSQHQINEGSPSGDVDTILVATRDGLLYLVNSSHSHSSQHTITVSGDNGAGGSAGGAVVALENETQLPLRLTKRPRSIAYDRARHQVLWLDTETNAIKSGAFDEANYTSFYAPGFSGYTREADASHSLHQVTLNSVNGYVYVVGGKEKLQVLDHNGTMLGRIVLLLAKPRLLAADEVTGMIFWIEDSQKADDIIQGASFGHPRYSIFFRLRGNNAFNITAMAANHNRLVFAENTKNTIRMCLFKDYDFSTTDPMMQTKCRSHTALLAGTGQVNSVIISGNTLYYANQSGLWMLALPEVNRSSWTVLGTRHVPRQLASADDIQSATLYRAGVRNDTRRSPNGCELSNPCRYFCQSVGTQHVCSCPMGMVLLSDNHTCIKTNCSSSEHYCQYGVQFGGGMQETKEKKCVPFTYECDSGCDCRKDCSDEGEYCTCPDGQFRCPVTAREKFKCYTAEQRCDGTADCENYHQGDERNCSVMCMGRGEKMCHDNATGEPICVKEEHFCDGIAHCSSGIDEDELLCGPAVTEPYELQDTSSHSLANLLTGVFSAILIAAIILGFVVFYMYHKGSGPGSVHTKRSSQDSMIGGDSSRFQVSSSSPSSGSVNVSEGSQNASNGDSAASPSKHTSSTQAAARNMMDLTQVHSVNMAAAAASTTATNQESNTYTVTGDRKIPSPDSSQKDSGHGAGSPCDLSNNESDSDGGEPSDDHTYTDDGMCSEDEGLSAPADALQSINMDELLSITTAEVNKVPTMSKPPPALAGPPVQQHRASPLVVGTSGGGSGSIPVHSSASQHMAIYPQSPAAPPAYYNGGGGGGPRRPKHAPYDNYPPPVSVDYSHMYGDCGSEDMSTADGLDGMGGPCPSVCSQPISYVGHPGHPAAPCPSISDCSVPDHSEVSEYSYSDVTGGSRSQYSGGSEYSSGTQQNQQAQHHPHPHLQQQQHHHHPHLQQQQHHHHPHLQQQQAQHH